MIIGMAVITAMQISVDRNVKLNSFDRTRHTYEPTKIY